MKCARCGHVQEPAMLCEACREANPNHEPAGSPEGGQFASVDSGSTDVQTGGFTRTLDYGRGYTGKMGNKPYVANIVGSSERYGLERKFIEPNKVIKDKFNSSRTMIHFTYTLPVGLYEMAEGGEKHFFAVNIKDGKHNAFRVDDARVQAMAKLMDGGMSADDARKATKPAKT